MTARQAMLTAIEAGQKTEDYKAVMERIRASASKGYFSCRLGTEYVETWEILKAEGFIVQNDSVYWGAVR